MRPHTILKNFGLEAFQDIIGCSCEDVDGWLCDGEVTQADLHYKGCELKTAWFIRTESDTSVGIFPQYLPSRAFSTWEELCAFVTSEEGYKEIVKFAE